MQLTLLKRLFSVFITVLLLFSTDISAKETFSHKKIATNNDCGVNCVIVACKLLGKDTDREEISKHANFGINGTSFYDMSNALRQKGLFCKGVKWNLNQLKNWNQLAIAHWENHFVLINGFEEPQSIRVIDPPKMPFSMSVKTFGRRWDGKLLLISEKPIHLWASWGKTFSFFLLTLCCLFIVGLFMPFKLIAKRFEKLNYHATSILPRSSMSLLLLATTLFPDLVITQKAHAKLEDIELNISCFELKDKVDPELKIDLGRIKQDSRIEHMLILENKTDQLVKIKGVSTSCSCTAAIVSKKEISPGEIIGISFALDTVGMFGSFVKPASITLENPELKPIRIELTGFVFAPNVVFYPTRTDFSEVLIGTSASRVIKILNKNDKQAKWKITGLKSSSNAIKADYQPNKGTIICQITDSNSIGSFEEKIFVEITYPNKVSTTEIPVVGTIIGPLKVLPKKLFIGTVKMGQLAKAGFSVPNLKKDLNYALTPVNNSVKLELLRQKEDMLEYNVEIKSPHKPGFFKGEIILKTELQEQPFLYIPYAGFVRE